MNVTIAQLCRAKKLRIREAHKVSSLNWKAVGSSRGASAMENYERYYIERDDDHCHDFTIMGGIVDCSSVYPFSAMMSQQADTNRAISWIVINKVHE